MIVDELADYLDEAFRRPLAYGEHDCILFPATWVWRRCGIDPAAEWRGTYGTYREMRALLALAGGMVKAVSGPMAALGLPETDQPQTGDVGLVQAPVQVGRRIVMRPIGAIRTGGMWVCLAERGMVADERLPTVRAWSVQGGPLARPAGCQSFRSSSRDIASASSSASP